MDRERDGSEAQMHQRLPNASKAFFDMPLLFGSGSLDFVIDHDADLHVLEIRCRGQCEARSGARVQARQFVTRNPLLRSEEHTSELQSLMRISYAVFCLKKKPKHNAQWILYNINHDNAQSPQPKVHLNPTYSLYFYSSSLHPNSI